MTSDDDEPLISPNFRDPASGEGDPKVLGNALIQDLISIRQAYGDVGPKLGPELTDRAEPVVEDAAAREQRHATTQT